jgi:hypothetical protein
MCTSTTRIFLGKNTPTSLGLGVQCFCPRTLGQDLFSLHYLGIMNRAQQSRNNQTVVNASRCDLSLHTSRWTWLRSQFTTAEILSAIVFAQKSAAVTSRWAKASGRENQRPYISTAWCKGVVPTHALSQTGWLYLGPCLSTSAGDSCVVLILFLDKTRLHKCIFRQVF